MLDHCILARRRAARRKLKQIKGACNYNDDLDLDDDNEDELGMCFAHWQSALYHRFKKFLRFLFLQRLYVFNPFIFPTFYAFRNKKLYKNST